MEVLESRLMMSAAAQTASSPAASSPAIAELESAATTYGFAGRGQTVAIVDTGIAYDHPALGGGYGPGFRVVGGWDFSEEQDADPYDDGPWGARGTHLAGIIGADAGPQPGVAPEVDLVALRVFNDQGEGELESVKNALAWIVEHRDAFEHPITTVSLAITVPQFNDDQLPVWAALEEELEALHAAGVFVAVAAGDHFTSFDQPGLNYPAVSEFVFPVMSHDADGLLSFYSQRHSGAIAAPGRDVLSAAPDYAGDDNGIVADYQTYSGTGAAASALAGASVVVREALEFAGHEDVTPELIYSEIVSAADRVYDPATAAWYDRLNLAATLSQIVSDDDYGSTVATAHDAGNLGPQDPVRLAGTIGQPADVDYFTFTAERTGVFRLEAVEATDDLQVAWSVVDAPWQLDRDDADVLLVHVLAGQEVTIGLATGRGTGRYEIDATAAPSGVLGAWAPDVQTRVVDVRIDPAGWFSLTAVQDGYLTVEAAGDASDNIALDLFDQHLRQIASGEGRVDALVSAGDRFLLRARGADRSVDFTITNLVSLKDRAALIAGTATDDVFTVTSGESSGVVVDGVVYDFPVATADVFLVAGYGGNDRLVLAGAGALDVQTSRIEQVEDLDAAAFALRNDLGLRQASNESLNYGGLSEKWLKGDNERWYFITPDGAFYKADSDFSESTQIAQLDPYFYADLARLYDAEPTRFMIDQRAIGIDRVLGLFVETEYFENWGGWGERWMKSDNGAWYFVTPAGDLYRWNGADDLAESQQVASLSSAYHADPKRLHEASVRQSYLSEMASRLDANLGFHAPPSYDQNWGGWDEKWIPSTNDYWHFLTPAGGLYRWNHSPNLAGSTLVAVFDKTFYDNPALLHEAVTPDAELFAAAAVSGPQGIDELLWLGQAVSSLLSDNRAEPDVPALAKASAEETAILSAEPTGLFHATNAGTPENATPTQEEATTLRLAAIDKAFADTKPWERLAADFSDGAADQPIGRA